MRVALQSPPQSLAPWAEVVPGYGSVTVDILLKLPDDGYQYEVVQGVLVRMAGSGEEATTIAVALAAELLHHVRPQRLGRVTGADGVYKFPGAETGLIPDVGFYSIARRDQAPVRRGPIPFAPDLAIEVASPDQTPNAMAAKAQLYLRGGTRLVWIIWPSSEHIDVRRSGSELAPAMSLNTSNSLNGEDVVPGFTYPVAAVFADPLDDITDSKS